MRDARSLVRTASLLAALACGCGRTEVPAQAGSAPPERAADASPAPPGVVPAPAPPAPPDAGSVPTASAPPRIEGSTAATRFFEVGKELRFAVVDVVDTHDPDAKGPARTSGEAKVVVRSVHAVGAAVVAEVEWSFPDSLSWVSMPERWALRAGNLWVLDTGLGPESIVTSDDELEPALDHTAPILAAAAAKRLVPASPPVCKEVRDKAPYGPTLLRACFDAQGLTTWVAQNLSGPRRLTLTRR